MSSSILPLPKKGTSLTIGRFKISSYFINDRPLLVENRGLYESPLEKSGYPGSALKFHRSPCPALNTLANHGYIPRDGKLLTIKTLATAVSETYNLPLWLSYLKVILAKAKLGLFSHFTLADLGAKDGPEHDASLFHFDSFLGKDPTQVNAEAVEALVALSNDGVWITLEELGNYRRVRSHDSITKNPSFRCDSSMKKITFGEGSLLLNLLGRDGKISVEALRR